ncbi:MAG: helix-hairpin-helix domain-containing protein [Chitinophagaceae bacterium]
MQQTYQGITGNKYYPGPEIGRGGEGAVYLLQHNDQLVLKLYNVAQSSDKSEKLRYMVNFSDQAIRNFSAWPHDVILDGRGLAIGFVMKKIRESVPLHKIFSPMDRKQLFPEKGYNFLVHVARNLAAAFHSLHAAGLIVGDVNEGNILVDGNGMVNFIDCDSFQVNNNGRIHFCEVGVPRYTPPELLARGTFENVIRSVNTDCFSMAVLIFQLLFLGRHPFAGRNLQNQDIDEDSAIRQHLFFYSLSGRNRNLQPPLNSLDIRELPSSLSKLFHRAFEELDNRPLSAEWVAETGSFLKDLITCKKSKQHFYWKHSTFCPWCAFREKNGIVFFMEDVEGDLAISDVKQFVQGFKIQRLRTPSIDLNYSFAGLTPAPPNPAYKNADTNTAIAVVVIIVSAVLLAIFVNVSFVFATLLLFWLNFLVPGRQAREKEIKARTLHYNSLKNLYTVAANDIKQGRELKAYNSAADNLSYLISDFQRLPEEFKRRQTDIEKELYHEKLHQFLAGFSIASASIPNFGPSRKETLRQHGIHSASDISRLHSKKIQGFGPTYVSTLLSWQRQIAARFSYVPDQEKLQLEMNRARLQFSQRRTELEKKIRHDYRNLQYLRQQTESKLSQLTARFEQLKKDLAQADLDMQAVRRLRNS